MVRILNFFLLGVAGLLCFALNHIAEKTRLADLELVSVHRQIASEAQAAKVLQADWQSVAEPSRIQRLAQSHLGLSDTPTLELSSLTLLPRRGEAEPGSENPLRAASMVAPAPNPDLHFVAANGGN
jgi:cell division protein FtsL